MLWERRIRVTDLESFSPRIRGRSSPGPSRAPWAEHMVGLRRSHRHSRVRFACHVAQGTVLARSDRIFGEGAHCAAKRLNPVWVQKFRHPSERPVNPIDRIVEEHGVATGQYCAFFFGSSVTGMPRLTRNSPWIRIEIAQLRRRVGRAMCPRHTRRIELPIESLL